MDYPKGIPECGADALRFGLVEQARQGNDVNLDIDRVVGYRHFCNKLWNAVKFGNMAMGADFKPTYGVVEEKCAEFGFVDKWILSRLNTAIRGMDEKLKAFEFADATSVIYHFWLNDFCDTYLELSKPVLRGDDAAAADISRNVLWTCIDCGLRLLHPMMPFVSEELYHRIPRAEGPELIQSPVFSISIAPYPQPVDQWASASIESDMKVVQSVSKACLGLRNNYKLTKQRPKLYVFAADEAMRTIVGATADVLATMGQVADVETLNDKSKLPENCAMQATSTDGVEVYMSLVGLIDFGAEVLRFEKSKEQKSDALSELEEKMQKAPDKVKEKNAPKMEGWRQEIASFEKEIASARASLEADKGAGAVRAINVKLETMRLEKRKTKVKKWISQLEKKAKKQKKATDEEKAENEVKFAGWRAELAEIETKLAASKASLEAPTGAEA